MARDDFPGSGDSSQGSFNILNSRGRHRAALLGAVAVIAMAGGIAGYSFVPYAANAAISQPDAAPTAGPSSFAGMIDKVKGAVVSVKVDMVENAADTSDGEGMQSGNGMPQLSPNDPLQHFFQQFGQQGGQLGQPQQQRKGIALGSGFIISPDGYVVTNNHVVENATDVTITLDNGKSVPATVIGTDKKTDLALLKIKGGSDYPFVQFASQAPRVGDWVVAVGNPFGLGGTVTAGIVSARGRDIGDGPYDDFLQIDAPVNRGNSGGPSFNTEGQVVGVNTAIYSPSGGSVGIGFAIPADEVKTVIASLEKNGSVQRGSLGVEIQTITPDMVDALGLSDNHGALVADTQPNSAAASAGIKSGDVITAVNGDKVDGPRDLAQKIAALGPNTKADVTYVRNGSDSTVSVQLGTLPADQQATAGQPSATGGDALASWGMSVAPASAMGDGSRLGVVVANVDPNGIAAQKGIRAGDVILEAAGKAVTRPSDIAAAVQTAKQEGRKAVLLQIKSADGTHFVALAMKAA